MAPSQLVIVGGGLASAKTVEAYREAGGDDRITLISADSAVPYHRPPLSKRYLRGEIEADGTYVAPPAFYGENDVELRLETHVERVRTDERVLELRGGERVPYDRLVVATGGTPRRLHVPGEELDGVLRLRTLADSTAIREAAGSARRAVVIGGSFIGSEVTASLRTLGLEVTLVHLGTGIFDLLGAPELTEYLNDLYRERGVELVLGDAVSEFTGNGGLKSVRTKGGRELEADMAVEGVGVSLNLGLLDGSGIEIDDGVIVSEGYETSVPGVFAAGDIANYPDPIAGRRRRIEHWSNANTTGSRLGMLLAGGDPGPLPVANFFSEVFGASFRILGDSVGYEVVATHGSFADGKAASLYADDEGTLRAALVFGLESEEEDELKALIERRAKAADVQVFAAR
jgi:3-phenylpropionate/trans-cinnamate dioxygenase ferredoxin reductase subunit